MTTFVKEKVQQAVQILREKKIDVWLTFLRETSAGGDPVLPLIYGQDLTWTSALIITAIGETIAIVGRYEAESVLRSNAYTTVIPYDQSIQPDLHRILYDLNPEQIAINYSLNDVHADGLTYGMYKLLVKYLSGTPLLDRLIPAEGLIAALRRYPCNRGGRGLLRGTSDGSRDRLIKKLVKIQYHNTSANL